MRRIFRKIAAPLLKFVIKFYFNGQYLRGRYFEDSYVGYKWALRSIWLRSILRIHPPLPWPASSSCIVSDVNNIEFHKDDLHIFQVPGIYFQNFKEKIKIGRGCYIAPNVGIITANHDINDLDLHNNGESVEIGNGCWIGMNSVILPGVTLGDKTIVAANSVVTKKFPDGRVILAGAPAKVIKVIS